MFIIFINMKAIIGFLILIKGYLELKSPQISLGPKSGTHLFILIYPNVALIT